MSKYQGFLWQVDEVSIGLCHQLGWIAGLVGPRALRAAFVLGPDNLAQLQELYNSCLNLMEKPWGSRDGWYSIPDVSFTETKMVYRSASGDTILIIEELPHSSYKYFYGRREGATPAEIPAVLLPGNSSGFGYTSETIEM